MYRKETEENYETQYKKNLTLKYGKKETKSQMI